MPSLLDMMNGTVNLCGKLPFSSPKRLENNPSFGNFPTTRDLVVECSERVHVGYRHYLTKGIETQFAFGSGLSYTSFELSNLRMSPSDGFPLVSVDVRNTGKVDGAEVVQVYVESPLKELKAFDKVYLKAGESKKVEIALDKYAFSHWDEALDKWVVKA